MATAHRLDSRSNATSGSPELESPERWALPQAVCRAACFEERLLPCAGAAQPRAKSEKPGSRQSELRDFFWKKLEMWKSSSLRLMKTRVLIGQHCYSPDNDALRKHHDIED